MIELVWFVYYHVLIRKLDVAFFFLFVFLLRFNINFSKYIYLLVLRAGKSNFLYDFHYFDKNVVFFNQNLFF